MEQIDFLRIAVELSGLRKPQFERRATKLLSQLFQQKSLKWVFLDGYSKMPQPNRCVWPIRNSKGQSLGFIETEASIKVSPEEQFQFEKLFATLAQSSIQLSLLNDLSLIDDVTGLYNQRHLHAVLDREVRRSERNGTSFSLLFIDIDHFKNVNDRGGHLMGSHLLVEVAHRLKQNIRAIDYGFRYGGDEFVLLLVGTSVLQAREVAERIRNAVESTCFRIEGDQLQLTLSIGVASYPTHAKTKEDLIKLADAAMYNGKRKSRNIVEIASESQHEAD